MKNAVLPSTLDPLPAGLRRTLWTWGLQVIVTASFAAAGFFSQLAGVAATLTIVAVLILGALARSWPAQESRSRAARAISLGICLAAALDTYLSARLLFDADRPIAAATGLVVAVVVALLSPAL